MPGFTTHYLFGEYAYKRILSDTPQLKQIITMHRNIYNLGMEGPDIFFYYLPSMLEWGINPGCVLHEKKTGEFFENFITYIKKKEDMEERELLYAYLAGFLGHYVMDWNCHPYIYDITQYNPLKKTPIQYHGQHISLERDMDTLLLKRWKKTMPSVFQNYRAIKITKRERNILTELLSHIISKTYQKTLKKATIKKAVITFYLGNKWLCDKKGKKRKIMSRIEQRVLGFSFLSGIITADEAEKKEDIFNLSHKQWSNPWDRKQKSTDSLFQLIALAAREYKTITAVFEQAIKEDRFWDIMNDKIGNRSYHSGLQI